LERASHGKGRHPARQLKQNVIFGSNAANCGWGGDGARGPVGRAGQPAIQPLAVEPGTRAALLPGNAASRKRATRRGTAAGRFEKPDVYLPIYLLNDRSPAASNGMGHPSVAQPAKEQESMSRLKTFTFIQNQLGIARLEAMAYGRMRAAA
jgi:hypothetical protein